LLLWVFGRLVGPLMFEQRQMHLAHSFGTPKPKVISGDAIAVLQIPVTGLNRIVVEGASVEHLRSGPARLAGSALPGDAGVMVVYGHRTAFGGPFEKNATLKNGDEIVIQARNGPIVKYIVDRVERDTRVTDVALGDDPGALAYLLLVNGEDRWTSGAQTVVVARSLPVTDADAVIPDLSVGPQRAVPITVETLLALGALASAVLGAAFLRGRANTVVIVAAALPAVALAALWLLISFESLLPIAR
jgi:LPXTG-site transpeptidase (sortase) family protein